MKATFSDIGKLLLESIGTALILSLLFWKALP
jgi:hypothetical protein